MALKNYLQLVNDVLVRLREPEASAVTDSAYVKLIARFVNDSKRVVEDSYNWNSLSETVTATTSNGIFRYSLNDSDQRFRVIDVVNDTSNFFMENVPTSKMNELFLMQSLVNGAPRYYNLNGIDLNGDTMVDVYPVPDGTYALRFNLIRPQPELLANEDEILVPHEPVVLGALARAQAERGEDGGVQSGETYQLMRQSLADAIALESGRYVEEQEWIAI
jgi:hypothetical protein